MALWLSSRAAGSQADAVEWLYYQGAGVTISAALAALLVRIWTEGWQLGEQSALAVLGGAGQLPAQALEDLLSRFAHAWTEQLTRTLLGGLGAILADGGTAGELERKIRQFLGNTDHAKRIVQTELTRAINVAAMAIYQALKVHMVRWVTEHDARVCPACAENEAAGAHPLGQPFPAGALFPPQHPRCRCALMPA